MSKFDDLYLFATELPCFDNDGDGDDAGENNADGGDANKASGNTGGERSFTQDDVNRIVEERLIRDRKKNEEKYLDLESRYSKLLENKNLTEEERNKLEGDLEDVRKKLRTKEEEAKHQMKQAQEQYESQLKEARDAAQIWEKRFKDSSITRELQDAAVAHEAYNPSQVVNLLKLTTEIRPQVDESTGKETGGFEVIVDLLDKDENGDSMMMRRTPDETVKRMSELPEYANLFKNNVVSGVGANSATGGMTPGSNGRVDVRKLTPEQYRKIRKENPELLGFRRKTQ